MEIRQPTRIGRSALLPAPRGKVANKAAGQGVSAPEKTDRSVRPDHWRALTSVRFGNTPPASLSPEALAKLNEDINDLNTHVRLAAIQKLFEQPELKDPDVLRSLGRYLFYNDIYQPLDSVGVQARLWTIKLLEKNKAFWAADGLFNNFREVGNSTIAKYAGAAFARSYPEFPTWIQERVRPRLYDWVTSGSTGQTSAISTQVLMRNAPLSDANYIWYLINMPGALPADTSTNSNIYGMAVSSSEGGRIRENLSRVLAGMVIRERGIDIFKPASDKLMALITDPVEKETPEEKQELQYQKRFYTSILALLPDTLQSISLRSSGRIQKILDTTLDIYQTFRSAELFTDASQGNYAATLGSLMLKLPLEERQPYVRQLMGLVDEKPGDNHLALTLFEVLYGGQFSREELASDYLTKKYHSNNKSAWMSNLKERIATCQASLDAPTSENLLQSYLPLLQEPNEIFQQESYIHRRPKINLSSGDFVFNPKDFEGLQTSEGLYGFDLKAPQNQTWQPKFTPASKITGEWQLEPFSARDTNQEVAFFMEMDRQFKEAVNSGVRANIQDILFRTLQTWMTERSRGAFDVLKENIANPVVFEQLTTMLWRLDDRKLATVPPKQLLSLFRAAASAQPLKTSQQGDMYQTLMSWQARNNPELRGELLQTALEMYRGANAEDAGTASAARVIFNLLKFGVPDWLWTDHADLQSDLLTAWSPMMEMSSTQKRGDLEWSFFSDASWETSSSGDRSSMDQKKNFDLAFQLALKAKHRPSIEKGIENLARYYNSVRNSAYVDEIFLIRYLRNPEVVAVGLTQEDEPRFQTFREMLAWYKVFEAVPQMIQLAAKGPLARTAWLMGTITAMDYYAVPELERIAQTSTNSREQALAREGLDQIVEPKRPPEMFRPFPYPLPSIFTELLAETEPSPGTPGKPVERQAMQIAFPGLMNPPPAETPSGQEPTEPSDTPEVPPPTSAPRPTQVRFPGMLETEGGEAPEDLSYMELMNRALVEFRSEDAEVRRQALEDLMFFAAQFREVSTARGSDIPFVTPEKAVVAQTVSTLLAERTDAGEKQGLLATLASLQDPVSLSPLVTFLQQEPDLALKQQALEILGDLGRSEARSVVREIVEDAQAPVALRRQAVRALIRMDDRDALLALSRQEEAPAELRLAGVEAVGELRIDTPEAIELLVSLVSDAANAQTPLKLAAVNALGQTADSDDVTVMTALMAAVNDETPAMKQAIIGAFEFLDMTDEVRAFMTRMRQDTNYDVSRAAAQFLLARP